MVLSTGSVLAQCWDGPVGSLVLSNPQYWLSAARVSAVLYTMLSGTTPGGCTRSLGGAVSTINCLWVPSTQRAFIPTHDPYTPPALLPALLSSCHHDSPNLCHCELRGTDHICVLVYTHVLAEASDDESPWHCRSFHANHTSSPLPLPGIIPSSM